MEIAITKNGYDILRIIELSSDGENCDFKIIPMVGAEKVDIYSRKLFSKSEIHDFDRNRKLEITYHKAKNKLPTKIHIKQINNNDATDIIYTTLPLTELLDPNVNTEIPIPLLRVLIPDEVLTKSFKKKSSKHKEFDIGNNNIIDIFLTKNGFINSDFQTKWTKISIIMLGNDLQYFATGLNKYVGSNLKMTLANKEENEVFTANIASDVTDDIGIQINTVKYPGKLRTNKLSMMFIENAAYLGFFNAKIKEENSTIYKEIYKYDIEKFSKEEQEKWEEFFKKERTKLDNYIISSNGKYDEQFN